MDFEGVFRFLERQVADGAACVLVTVCAVEGSSMRNPGSLMGVGADGSFEGSLSGGCIENAVVAEALDALAEQQPRIVRFGAGSPYLDIKLPCGGGLDVHFQPLGQDAHVVHAGLASIAAREPFSLACDGDRVEHFGGWQSSEILSPSGHWRFGYWPAPQLQIIGHGEGVEALAGLSRAMGIAPRILTPDERIRRSLDQKQFTVEALDRTSQTGLLKSDPWTATIFLFHDHDWEIELMEAALGQPHFYIGAMGGRQAHAFRKDALAARGVSEAAIATIHAPIGLFHSSRDPQTLALSTLAQVVEAYHQTDFEAALG